MGGTLAAIANIISIAATKNALQSGLFYFSIALIVLILAFLAYLLLPCFVSYFDINIHIQYY